MEIAVSNYKGCSAELLREQTAVWFDDEVLPRTRPLARAALDRHRAAGARCVLASSTTQFAAEAARRAYGLHDAVSSRLEVDAVSGCLTGRVAALAFGAGKAQRVREWATAHSVPLQRCTFYTDSFADATLLAEVGVPVCVNPDRRLRALAARRGWRVEDWGRSPAPVLLLKRK
jgi:HAD superfamily hydrolase (TIGR01490 family)